MINTIEEFSKLHPYAVIVNYDIANKFEYGMAYRTNKHSLESFCQIKGKYITYPYIQPYLTLNNSDYELFIIKDMKMYQLKLADEGKNYTIKCEIENVNPKIYMDDVFYNLKDIHKSVFIEQDILKII